jgi:hypothetical protein
MHRSLLALAFPALALATACPPPPPGEDAGSKPPSSIDDIETLAPSEGVTFHIPPFDVPPGAEQQDCYFVRVPDLNGDGSDMWIDRFKIGVRTGSHHMNIFRVGTILNLDGEAPASGVPGGLVRDGECFKSGNWADWPLVVNSQESSPESPVVDWQLPQDVAQRFSVGEKLMLQVHYVNADLQTTPDRGEVKVNFYKTLSESPIEMGTLFATQQSIRICRDNPNVTFDGACAFPAGQEIHIAAVNGHFHSRGEEFKLYTWDGQTDETPPASDQIYFSTSWDEPPMTIDLDETVPSGGGVWWSCEFAWEEPPAGCQVVQDRDPEHSDQCCYTFGGIVETSEHCNAFVYYWPKVDRTDIFCN